MLFGISLRSVLERFVIFAAAFFVGWVFAAEYVRHIDFIWIQHYGVYVGSAVVLVMGYFALVNLFSDGKNWIRMVPWMFVTGVYCHLAYVLSVPIVHNEVIVANNGEIIRPFHSSDAKKMFILTGHGRYRIVKGTTLETQARGLSLYFRFSDDAIRAWNKDESMSAVGLKAFNTVIDSVILEKRAARLAILADQTNGLNVRFCKEIQRVMETADCSLSNLRIGIAPYEYDPKWTGTYTVQEAIDEKAVKAATGLLLDRRSSITDAQREALLNVVLNDETGSAAQPYTLLTEIKNPSENEQKRLWGAVYARTDAACSLLTALREIRWLSDADRAHMRATAKATKDPECARLVLARAKSIGIDLSNEERVALRVLIARSTHSELMDRLLATGKSLDEIEREIWIDTLIQGDLYAVIRVFQNTQSQLTADERMRLLARVKEFFASDIQRNSYDSTTLFLDANVIPLTDLERADLWASLKIKAQSDSILAYYTTLGLLRRRADADKITEMLDIFVQSSITKTAGMIQQLSQYKVTHEALDRLFDRIIEGKEKKACQFALEAVSDRHYPLTVSDDKKKALKKCA